MREREKTTKLQLFLSNGVKIVIYYEGNIFDDLYSELENQRDTFLVSNWVYKQMCIYGGNNNLLFSGNEKDEPSQIDFKKVIGWNID